MIDNIDEKVSFVEVSNANVNSVQPLARKIWEVTYKSIISAQQMDYMLDKMYSIEKITDEISRGYVWELAVSNQQVIGYIDYVLQEDQRVFLSKIYLDPEIQNKGFGYIMLQRVVDYAKKNNAKCVYLTVNKNNLKAILFYERNGFVTVGDDRFDIGAGYIMDDYIMQCSVW